MSFHCPEQHRVINHPNKELTSDESFGNNGHFLIRSAGHPTNVFHVLASDGGGWEHVSVSILDYVPKKDHGKRYYKVSQVKRTPTWAEMNAIKDLFWGAEDTVMQLHPKKSEYVNTHPFVLHLWRPNAESVVIPVPPKEFVG